MFLDEFFFCNLDESAPNRINEHFKRKVISNSRMNVERRGM